MIVKCIYIKLGLQG